MQQYTACNMLVFHLHSQWYTVEDHQIVIFNRHT